MEATATAGTAAFEPRIQAFVCNWCTYTGADLAGTSRIPMAANVRVVRLPCTGRIDPLFVVKAFERGADGVIVSGCHPADCHYTAGNYHARRRFAVFRELLDFMGVDERRLTFSWVSASEGRKWADVVNETTERVRALGPFAAYPGRSGDGAASAGARRVGGSPSGAASSPSPRPSPSPSMSAELRELARKLLSEGAVSVVVGYEEGPRGVRPTFVRTPEDADRLVFDARCVQDLAAYLSPRRKHLLGLGKPAVVVKTCDARAVAGLLRESQRAREDVVLIGVRCGGVLSDPAGEGALTAETLADRCAGCATREPSSADFVVGPAQELPAGGAEKVDPRRARIAALEAQTPAERLAFWSGELADCVRCNACREVCPLCFCERCVADKSQPQWVETSPHLRGNFAWHLTRAMHLAGRCVDCGECERACPADLPLGLLTRKVAEVVERRFDWRPGEDPAAAAPIGAYRLDDAQEFIR